MTMCMYTLKGKKGRHAMKGSLHTDIIMGIDIKQIQNIQPLVQMMVTMLPNR